MCGKEPADTTEVVVAGSSYQVDLCARHRRALDTALRPFIDAARNTPSTTPTRKRTTAKATSTTKTRKAIQQKANTSSRRSRSAASNIAEIRAWGQANGYNVASKGRLRPDVVAAFEAAGKSAGSDTASPRQATRKRKAA